MSLQAMAWAIAQQRVKDPPARHVLLVLAQTASPEGEDAWRTVDRLAEETGLSDRTVQTKLQLLLTLGVIRLGDQDVVAVKIKRADRRPVVYDLDIRAEELIAAGIVNRKARGAGRSPRDGVDNFGDDGQSRGEGVSPRMAGQKPAGNTSSRGEAHAPRGGARGETDDVTGCSSLQKRGEGASPTPKALLQKRSSAQAGASAQAHPPARDWRTPSESPLQCALSHIRQQHGYGAYGEGAEADAERDRLIAEAHARYPDQVGEAA